MSKQRELLLMRWRWLFLTVILVSSSALSDRGISVTYKESESANAPVAGEMQLYSRSHALIIGIDDYTTWPRLSQAVNDAEQVAAVLRKKGFEVTLKTNLASRELVTAFEDFFIDKGTDPDARLFVWYAGHGHTVDGEGYLIPADGVFESDRGNFLRRSISLRDFGKYSRLAQSKHVYTIFDSCFAGTVFNVARSAPPPAITRVTSEPVRQFLTSGDAGQTVSDDGTFARLFVEALEGKRRADLNHDGYITADELGGFLTTSISNYTNNKQVPRHGKLRDPNFDRGDFVFLGTPGLGPVKVRPLAQDSSPWTPGDYRSRGQLIFEEGFDDNHRGWGAGSYENDGMKFSVESGAYRIQRTRDGYWYKYWDGKGFRYPSIDAEYLVEIRARHLGGVDNYGFGIVWDLSDVRGQLHTINASGSYWLGEKISGGDWIGSWAESPHLSASDWNTLSFTRGPDGYEFYINDRKVGSRPLSASQDGTFSFFVNNKQTVAFDDIKIYLKQPTGKSAPSDHLRNVTLKLYETGKENIDRGDRTYTDEFNARKTRRIRIEVNAFNANFADSHAHDVEWYWVKPDGTVQGNISAQWNVKPDWTTVYIDRNWGWDSRGNWQRGNYTARVVVDGVVYEAPFSVR